MHTRVLSLAALTVVALGGVVGASPALAADTDIRINEVQSNSATGAPDFVELLNAGTDPVDVGGWVLRDDQDANGDVIAAGTTIAPGAFLVIQPTFGLGANDSARLFDDALVAIDATSWTAHAFTEGRLPDGTGSFVDTEPTPGEPNVARAVTVEPVPVETGIRINEVLSNDPVLEDFVELTNVGAMPVDISGWLLR
ncbi:lamin tail domain-containing protein, partial [Burkholderia cenocepacia]|uniref:lamin tail domain-containing protein n=1 Tax=Burkholderia cenocepacia TaxID=95486 RepID=UPI0038CBF3EA